MKSYFTKSIFPIQKYLFFQKVFLLTLLLLSTLIAEAATVTWLGTDDDKWDNPANWSSNAVPSITDDVIIDRPGGIAFNPVIDDSFTQVSSILITSGDKLTINWNKFLFISHTGTSYGMRVEGELELFGSLEIRDAFLNGMQIVSGGIATIHGSTYVHHCVRNGIFVEGELFIGKNTSDPSASVPSVEIYECGDDGMFINSSGEVEINDASILIGDGTFNLSDESVEFGIYNKNVFNFILGTMTIQNTRADGISNEGSIFKLNAGSFMCENIGSDGIANNDMMTINASMNVTIFDTNRDAFNNYNGATTTNNGTLNLGLIGSIGRNALVTSEENTSFTNNGTINISNATIDGITLSQSAKFTNTGLINIGQDGNTVRSCVLTNTSGFFINDGGIMNIDNGRTASIYRSVQEDEPSKCYNRNGGVINIDLNYPPAHTAGAFSLFDQAFFVNESCSKIIIGNGSMINESSHFDNLGTILDYSGYNSSIYENSGTIYNLGGGNFTYSIGGVGAAVLTTLDHTWTGCIDNDWSKDANWSSIKPTDNDHAIVVDATNQPIVSQTETIKSLEVQTNGLLTINDVLQVENSVANAVFVDGTIEVNELLSIDDAGEDGLLINGTVNVNDGGNIGLFNSINDQLVINSTGTLDIDDSGGILCISSNTSDGASLVNDGTVHNEGNYLVASNEHQSGNHIINNNQFINHGLFGLSATDAEFDFLFSNSGDVINDSTFTITTNTNNSNIGLVNFGSFYNQGGADDTLSINNNNTLFIAGGIVENSSIIHVENDIIVSSDTLRNIAPGIISTESDFSINESGVFDLSNILYVDGDFTNNGGTFNPYFDFLSGIFFEGADNSTITGVDSLVIAVVNKDNKDLKLILDGDLFLDGWLTMDHGNLDLNGNVLDISNGIIFTESDTSYITSSVNNTLNSGYVKYDGLVNTLSGANPGNIGVSITASQSVGDMEIRRYPTTHHDITGETRLTRLYTIEPETVTTPITDAEITLDYLDVELNGVAETEVAPYVILTSETPEPNPKHALSLQDTDENKLSYRGLYPQNTVLLASRDDIGELIWTGAEDTDWDNPYNWNIMGPPTELSNVTIPDVNNDPIQHTETKIKNLEIQSNVAMTSSADLTLTENLIGSATSELTLSNDLNIGSTYTGNGMSIDLIGVDTSEIVIPNTVNLDTLTLNKIGDGAFMMRCSINVDGELRMISGNLDLNGNILDIVNGEIIGESANSYITSSLADMPNFFGAGVVRYRGEYNSINTDQDSKGLGISINSPDPLGQLVFGRFHTNIYPTNRVYFLVAESGFVLPNNGEDVKITFEYFDHELNGIAESDVRPFIVVPAVSEFAFERVILDQDETANTMTYRGFNEASFIIPAQSIANGQLIWTGAQDTDWHNPNNWNIFGIPNKLYDVFIPDTDNDPIVNTHPTYPAECKTIETEIGATLEILGEFEVVIWDNN